MVTTILLAPLPSLCAVSGLVAAGASCSCVAQSESERRDDNTYQLSHNTASMRDSDT